MNASHGTPATPFLYIEHTRKRLDVDGQEVEDYIAGGFHAGLGWEEPDVAGSHVT